MSIQKKSILLSNEYPLIAEGIISHLKRDEQLDINLIDFSENCAINTAKIQTPDIIILDVNKSRRNFLSNRKEFSAHFPNANLLILSTAATRELIFKALVLGASGYILPDISKKELATAIHVILDGGSYFSPDISNLIAYEKEKKVKMNPLTEKEKNILIAVTHGKSNKIIAYDFNISIRTVETHRKNIMRKINVKSAVGMTIYAIENNLVNLQCLSSS